MFMGVLIFIDPWLSLYEMSSIDPFVDHEIKRRIDLFRELDSMIDFSKSSYQLDIVVFMGSAGGPVSIDAIVSALGVDRKQILDAIRKLRLKNIVAVDKGFCVLTDIGMRFYKALVGELAGDKGNGDGDVVRIMRRIRRIAVAIDVIKLLGIWGRPLMLYRVARSLGLGVPETLEILSPFIRDMGGEDIIRIVDCRYGILSRRYSKCISLSRAGIDIARGIPEIRRYRVLYRLLGLITGSESLDIAVERAMIYIFSIATLMIVLHPTQLAKISLVAGYSAITFLVSLYIISRRILKLYSKPH